MSPPAQSPRNPLFGPLPAAAPALLALLVVAGAVYLMADAYGWFYAFDPFGSFPILGDDHPYLAESRTGSAFRANLFTPHNAHVVPIFRAWVHLVGRLAGSLEALPVALGAASALVLTLTMLAAGHLISAETGRPAIGLACMSLLGVSTVIEPAACWFSAAQALWAALLTVLMLLALRSWVARPSTLRLGAAALAAAAAPAFWSGGFAAGPVGVAYLFASVGAADRRRWITYTPLMASVIALATLFTLARRETGRPTENSGPPVSAVGRVVRAVSHVGQAIPEALVIGNIGVSSATSPGQGAILTAAIVAAWAWSRRGRGPIRPLEAAGATMVVASFGMAFLLRAGYEYSSLRGLGWYHAMPQVGWALLVGGWWSAIAGPGRPGTISALGAIGVVGLVVAMSIVHAPAAQVFFQGRLPEMTKRELERFAIPSLKRERALALQAERTKWQRDALHRLDLTEAIATRLGASRGAIRRRFGPIYLPLWPKVVARPDAIDLLDIPADGPDLDERAASAIGPYLGEQPQPRPIYFDLMPGEPWPPPGWFDGH